MENKMNDNSGQLAIVGEKMRGKYLYESCAINNFQTSK